MPTVFPCQAMESVGATASRWPGAYLGLPPNTPYQYIDKQYLPDEDYDEFPHADLGGFARREFA